MQQGRRLSPTELRFLQEAREKEEQAEAERLRLAQLDAILAQERQRAEAAADRIKEHWYNEVTLAARHSKVRFVVLAKISGAEHQDLVQSVRETIEASEYSTRLSSIFPTCEDEQKAREVRDEKGVLGWKHGSIPKFGSMGVSDTYLLVGW